MKVLAFDTSSKVLSVAILDGDVLLGEFSLNIKKNHSITLMPAIDFLMTSVGWQPSDLERVIVAEGPGSYTGLRIAVATAKTLAYTLGIDLVGVSSLYALLSDNDDSVQIPLIDARRGCVYAGFYQKGQAIQADAYQELREVFKRAESYDKVTFVGETAVFASQIRDYFPTARIKETMPSAEWIGRHGQTLSPADVTTFTPEYLKRVEAEENWLKTHQENLQDNYIKRV